MPNEDFRSTPENDDDADELDVAAREAIGRLDQVVDEADKDDDDDDDDDVGPLSPGEARPPWAVNKARRTTKRTEQDQVAGPPEERNKMEEVRVSILA